MTFLARVSVLPKDEVLDPQGEAILGALRHLELTGVTAVRSGRLFELHIDTDDRAAAEQIASEAARHLLSNPVVETYHLTVEPLAGASEALP